MVISFRPFTQYKSSIYKILTTKKKKNHQETEPNINTLPITKEEKTKKSQHRKMRRDRIYRIGDDRENLKLR